MLPTEEQWQYAAQGDDGRRYPWGNKWECARCNNSVKPCESDRTTPVTHYEGFGDSPSGVVDMTGNVWEWCLTSDDGRLNDIHSSANYRVNRGGSWVNDYARYFSFKSRNRISPRNYNYDLGFRIVRNNA